MLKCAKQKFGVFKWAFFIKCQRNVTFIIKERPDNGPRRLRQWNPRVSMILEKNQVRISHVLPKCYCTLSSGFVQRLPGTGFCSQTRTCKFFVFFYFKNSLASATLLFLLVHFALKSRRHYFREFYNQQSILSWGCEFIRLSQMLGIRISIPSAPVGMANRIRGKCDSRQTKQIAVSHHPFTCKFLAEAEEKILSR